MNFQNKLSCGQFIPNLREVWHQRITRSFRLQWITWHHLGQPHCSSRVSYNKLLRIMLNCFLNISMHGDYTTSLISLFPLFEHLYSKRWSGTSCVLICAWYLLSFHWTSLKRDLSWSSVSCHQFFIRVLWPTGNPLAKITQNLYVLFLSTRPKQTRLRGEDDKHSSAVMKSSK